MSKQPKPDYNTKRQLLPEEIEPILQEWWDKLHSYEWLYANMPCTPAVTKRILRGEFYAEVKKPWVGKSGYRKRIPLETRIEAKRLYYECGWTSTQLAEKFGGDAKLWAIAVVTHPLPKPRDQWKKKPVQEFTALTDEQVIAGIALYYDTMCKISVIAEMWDCTYHQARGVLEGKYYPHLERPRDMQVPWGQPHPRQFREDKGPAVKQALRDYVKNDWSVGQLARALGTRHFVAEGIIKGTKFKRVQRPRSLQMLIEEKQLFGDDWDE
jgi:hypothetical protein